MNRAIYLDYNATTPLDPEVLKAMMPYLTEEFGNSSSRSHPYGWEAEAAVEKARGQVAKAIGAQLKEIVWTSGATESNNLAILGLLRQFIQTRPHLITSAVEHKAVLDVCSMCQEWGVEVTVLPVNRYGQVEVSQLAEAIQPNTRLISIMMANNEIGSLNPIEDIGRLAKSRGIFFHVDGAQAVGKVPVDVNSLGIDLLSMSGHKIYGPKGIGALYVRGKNPQVLLKPMMAGGSQECGLRPGTVNVAGVVGLGKAIEMAVEKMDEENTRLREMRDRLIQKVIQGLPRVILNGHPVERLSNNASFSFPGLSADVFALGLSGLAVSSGSACNSGNGHPSHVLKAVGLSEELARATVRIGIGRFTTMTEIETAAAKILQMATKNQVISVV